MIPVLYEHQKKALALTAKHNRCAYYLDMGLGKTFVGTEKMISLGARYNLLVCQKSKVQDWVEHFRKYTDLTVFDATSTKKDEKRSYEYGFWMNYRNGAKEVPSVIVINYDLLWRRPEIATLEHFTLMLDESSLIQNHAAKRTKFVLKLQPENVILLSGTPTSGRCERLWTQMHLLGWPISRRLYEQTYVIWDQLQIPGMQYPIRVPRGYKNVDRLKSKMAEHGCVFMKTEECFDLPDQQDITIRVDPSAEYAKFMRHRYACLKDGTELAGSTALTMRLYARQLCGQYNRAKLSAMEDLIESTEDRLLVFYNFNAELAELKSICRDRPLSVVNGATKDLRAYESKSDSITLIQYQAGAYGLNLQKARQVVYFTPPESSELYEQSRKRIHRIGQNRRCLYYHLQCSGSIEDKIMKALKERKDYTDELFKKDYYRD